MKHVFLVCALESTPNHIPLEYKYLDYCCVGIRHVYLLEIASSCHFHHIGDDIIFEYEYTFMNYYNLVTGNSS